MPHAATAIPSSPDAWERLDRFFAAATQFVARERAEAIIRKWLSRHDSDLDMVPEDRMLAMMADAVLLSSDLLVSQPSPSGATAFDRMARSLGTMPPDDAAAIMALGKARFRLIRLDSQAADAVIAQDILTGEALRLDGMELPPLPPETHLFARAAMLGAGHVRLTGAITPLDGTALGIAREHPAAGAGSATANARWAEAVYGHVVRHGTLDVPGLNRPDEDSDPDDVLGNIDDDLLDLACGWAALAGAAPDDELVQQTRQIADLPTILDALAAAIRSREAWEGEAEAVFERILQVQLETVSLRKRGGSGGLTLDLIRHALDEAIARQGWPASVRSLFNTLRARHCAASRAGDPALDRLVQRIQALRAKTVAQGCTEQEAIAAAEKVAELLDRYGLSLGELELQAQPCEGIGVETGRRRMGPIDDCVPGVAAFFDCRVWAERAAGAPLRYIFFGLRGDVTAVEYLYEMVARAFETETDNFRASEIYLEMAGERRSATNSFQIGLARGIMAKLQSLRGARSSVMRSASGRDLVPMKAATVDEEMAKLGLNLRRREVARGKRVLSDAYALGEDAGRRFEFAHALTAPA